MAEWLGAYMQGWPTWAIVAVLVVVMTAWFLIEIGYIGPYRKKRHYLGEKKHGKK